MQPSLPLVPLVQWEGDGFLSVSHPSCTKEPGLGCPSSAFKEEISVILRVSQSSHLACVQAEGVEISVFPGVGWKSLAFDEVVKHLCLQER